MPIAAPLRTTAAFCATAAAFGVCFVMLRDVIGSQSPWLGLLLMFDFMGLAKVGEPLFVLRMPGRIRDVRAWEASGAAYQRFGVQRFGQLLRGSPLRFLNTSVYRGKQDLDSLYRHAAASEATHFWAALLFTPYIVFVWARGQSGVAAFFLLIQVLFNVYPILHLRLLRARLGPLLSKRFRVCDKMPPC
jgi:hypothetical protein